MKKIALSVLSLVLFTGITQTTQAQKDKQAENKNEEIIIRKHGDKNIKMTLEINGDEVLINGKPMAEFKDDDITVMKRKSIAGNDNNFMLAPQMKGGMQFWNDDNDENENKTFLGVTTEEEDNGVKITDVVKESAAEKAGLQQGDVITKIESKKISDPEDLVDAVTSYKPKDEIKVYYKREGKSKDVKVTLGERKERRIRSFSFNSPGGPMNGKMFKNFNYQMPPGGADALQPFMKLWSPDNKRLGVRIEDIENNGGAKITRVEEGSAAEKAGLKKEDIITTVNGNKVKNVDEVRSQIMNLKDKSAYTIKAKRSGADMDFEIKIPKKVNNADL